MRKPRYRKTPCRFCGAYVTTNAMGRAAHERSIQCSRTFQNWRAGQPDGKATTARFKAWRAERENEQS